MFSSPFSPYRPQKIWSQRNNGSEGQPGMSNMSNLPNISNMPTMHQQPPMPPWESCSRGTYSNIGGCETTEDSFVCSPSMAYTSAGFPSIFYPNASSQAFERNAPAVHNGASEPTGVMGSNATTGLVRTNGFNRATGPAEAAGFNSNTGLWRGNGLNRPPGPAEAAGSSAGFGRANMFNMAPGLAEATGPPVHMDAPTPIAPEPVFLPYPRSNSVFMADPNNRFPGGPPGYATTCGTYHPGANQAFSYFATKIVPCYSIVFQPVGILCPPQVPPFQHNPYANNHNGFNPPDYGPVNTVPFNTLCETSRDFGPGIQQEIQPVNRTPVEPDIQLELVPDIPHVANPHFSHSIEPCAGPSSMINGRQFPRAPANNPNMHQQFLNGPYAFPNGNYQFSNGSYYPPPPMVLQPATMELASLRAHNTFDANFDANALRKALKRYGTDQTTIIEIVARRSAHQRAAIVTAFQTCFNSSLLEELKGALKNPFRNVVLALMTDRYDYLAERLHYAIEGKGTRERIIVDILGTADPKEMRVLSRSYNKLFNSPLEKDLEGEASCHFRRIFLATLACGRIDGHVARSEIAKADAKLLFQSGEIPWMRDEASFNMIFSTRDYPTLKQMLHDYECLSGHPFEADVEKVFSEDTKDSMILLVRCLKNRSMYFAERIRDAIAKRPGLDEDELAYLIVSRCEIDSEKIKRQYLDAYRRNMLEDVSAVTIGDHRRILRTLLGFY